MAFDAEAATAAYVDSIGAEALAKSAAYTAGNHWLLLWNLVVGLLIAWLIIRSGVLERLEARLSQRGPNVRALTIAVTYFILAGLLTMPWVLYSRWWRNTDYGRSSQPFGDALGQELLGLVIASLLAGLFFTGVFALIRRTGRRWWLWSAGLAAVAITAILLVTPVAIEPLFNRFEPLPPGPVREAVLAMAQQAGVPGERIFVFDGSRQSNNFTANVGGLGPYKRIALSDVALKGASLDEVRAVTAHEIGHDRLGHVWQRLALLVFVVMVSFFVADRLYRPVASLLGSRAPLSSATSLPVVMLLVSLRSVLATPLVNGFIRRGERQADRYSLEMVGLPDALASSLVKTAEYRYPRPGEVQEFLFYSHPSVERRVRAAMQWKAAHGGETPR